MKTLRKAYHQLCSYDNLYLAYKKARKGKTTKDYVLSFEEQLQDNLNLLQTELLLHSYRPAPLREFILLDPKTRKISVSQFRDRIVHHALCNIIGPILEKKFICDSFANRIGKGTLKAIQRFDYFKRKVSHNLSLIKDGTNIKSYVLKGDIRQFFDSVNHENLIRIIQRTIKDKKILWLVKIILSNYNSKEMGRGMPLGNLTSQFFANVYLNELDQFVKHELKAKYYLRYVDDFTILHHSKEKQAGYKNKIDQFLNHKLDLQLHPDKSKIFPLYQGTRFLGVRIFPRHKLLIPKNVNRFRAKLNYWLDAYLRQSANYDSIYNFLSGWIAYIKYTNSYRLKTRLINPLSEIFTHEISTIEINRNYKENKNSNTHTHPKACTVPSSVEKESLL